MKQRGEKRRRQIFILREGKTLPVLVLRLSNFKGGSAKVAFFSESTYALNVKL